jgi:hypothetical protein
MAIFDAHRNKESLDRPCLSFEVSTQQTFLDKLGWLLSGPPKAIGAFLPEIMAEDPCYGAKFHEVGLSTFAYNELADSGRHLGVYRQDDIGCPEFKAYLVDRFEDGVLFEADPRAHRRTLRLPDYRRIDGASRSIGAAAVWCMLEDK